MSKQYRFLGALNSAEFPFVSSFQGRTVVNPQMDNNVKTNQAFYGTQESANYGIPQLLYCENVLPTGEGLQSVGYEELIAGIPGATDFDQAITLRDEDENNFIFVPAGGKNYIYRGDTGVWVSTNPISAESRAVSRAYVNGRTFICYSGLGIYEYNSSTGVFGKLTLTGLADADITSIGSSNNYLIAATKITVFWSSLIDQTDFVPSILTGAGFSIPQDVKAEITAVIGTAGGFIIYTAKNAVAAVYTNNIRAPFSFREISNAGGVPSYEQVTSESTSGPQFVWSTGGLQKVVPQGAEDVSAKANDFLAGGRWEYWDAVAKRLVKQAGGGVEFGVKVAYIASRFLVISYSVDTTDSYQYALVFDTGLNRWGKLKITHTDCFAFPYPNVGADPAYEDLAATSYEALGDATYEGLTIGGIRSRTPSKRTLAFLQSDGTVQLTLMTYDKDVAQQGVAIFGKFQLVRSQVMTLQALELEGGYSTVDTEEPLITVTALASLDGKNLDVTEQLQLLDSSEDYQEYGSKRLTGKSVSVAIEGTFALSTYMLEVTADGER